MSINSISSVSSSYSFSSGNSDDELIKKKLVALGIVPTANVSTNRALLQKAEKPDKGNKPVQPINGGPPPIPAEWQSLMSQLGITPTGDLAADHRKATEVINSKIATATTEPEKDKYRNLQTQIDNFVANNKKPSASAMVGATMLSEMNKLSMLK